MAKAARMVRTWNYKKYTRHEYNELHRFLLLRLAHANQLIRSLELIIILKTYRYLIANKQASKQTSNQDKWQIEIGENDCVGWGQLKMTKPNDFNMLLKK